MYLFHSAFECPAGETRAHCGAGLYRLSGADNGASFRLFENGITACQGGEWTQRVERLGSARQSFLTAFEHAAHGVAELSIQM